MNASSINVINHEALTCFGILPRTKSVLYAYISYWIPSISPETHTRSVFNLKVCKQMPDDWKTYSLS